MLHRDRIFILSIYLLFSSPVFSSDPKENSNVEYITTTHEGGLGVLPKSPEIEPQFLGTNRPIPSNVGSSAGGSILNFVAAVADYFKGPQPDYDKMRRDTKNQKFIECISKSGPQVAAQFYPEETTAYLEKKYAQEMADMMKQASTVVTPAPISTPIPQSTVHVAGFPSNVRHTPQAAAQYFANQQTAATVSPTPAPVVSASTPSSTSGYADPVAVSTPTALSTTSIVLTSGSLPSSAPIVAVPTPAPVVTTPTVLSTTSLVVTSMVAPANPSSIIPGLGTAPTLGGLQGSTQLLKPPFSVYNPGSAPTMNELLPPKAYIKPLPVQPAPTVSNDTSNNITPEKAGGIAAIAGALLSNPVGQAVIIVGTGCFIGWQIGKATDHLFKKGLDKLSRAWLGKPASELGKKPLEAVAHRQIHETVHAPTPTPQPTSQSHIAPRPDLPAHLQPSDNPLKLGKKIYQPGPQPGQGDRPHGYKDKWGHYRDYTPENVAHAIESVEKGVWHGQSPENGKHIYTYDCPKTGLQKWAEVDNTGGILNCGINEVPHTVCPKTKKFIAPTGFKKPSGKNTGWVDKTLKVGVISTALDSLYTSTTPIFRSLGEEDLPTAHYYLPPAPQEITVHDLYAERMLKNNFVAMEQKKIEVIQRKMNESSNL